MLDFDLARMYGIETKVLKQAVRRNLKRFPSDFMFELSQDEFALLRSQFVTSNKKGGEIHAICFYRTRSCHAFICFKL